MMLKIKKILFITGTRADYGKIKSLLMFLTKTKNSSSFICYWDALVEKFGYTVEEVKKEKAKLITIFQIVVKVKKWILCFLKQLLVYPNKLKKTNQI